MPSPRSCEVLLVTVTDAETRAVLAAVEAASTTKHRFEFGAEKTYFHLGELGGVDVGLVRSEPGSAQPGGATTTIRDAMKEVAPQVVILVGTAVGLRREAQPLGVVLVAQQILAYDARAVRTRSDGAPTEHGRGERRTASARVLDRMHTAAMNWDGEVMFGLVLSGGTSPGHSDELARLLALAPEALGAELEGVGLHAAVGGLDCIVVKAVRCWADGPEATPEDEARAADCAARFVVHAIGQGGFAATPATSVATPGRGRRVLVGFVGLATLAGFAVWFGHGRDTPVPVVAPPKPSPGPMPALTRPSATPSEPSNNPDETPGTDTSTSIPPKKASGKISIVQSKNTPKPDITPLVPPPEAVGAAPAPAPLSGDAVCAENQCKLTAKNGNFIGTTHVCLAVPDRDTRVRCTVDGVSEQATALCNFSSVAQKFNGTASWTSC